MGHRLRGRLVACAFGIAYSQSDITYSQTRSTGEPIAMSNIIYRPLNSSKARLRGAEDARRNRRKIVKAWFQGQVSRRELLAGS